MIIVCLWSGPGLWLASSGRRSGHGRVGRGQWIIGSSGIPFADYPFFPATVFPAATIAWEQVDDIDPLAPPPTVRVGAELLMVSAVHRDKLAEAASQDRPPPPGPATISGQHASRARSAQRRADRPRRAGRPRAGR